MAPRLTLRLIDEIERRSKRRLPIAEINRQVGEAAAGFGLTKPSYERVRVLVHQARSLRRAGPDSFSDRRPRGPLPRQAAAGADGSRLRRPGAPSP